VHITAQLIEARSDTNLWSQTYDHTLDDIFSIQEDPRWLPFLESIGKSPAQLDEIKFEVSVPQQGRWTGSNHSLRRAACDRKR
jgi:hypothetical protein